MGATQKAKPKLHLVLGGKDPEMYCADLDWFFGCYDSECGLKSIGTPLSLWEAMGGAGGWRTTVDEYARRVSVAVPAKMNYDPYTDKHVTFGARVGSFTRARKIWRKLRCVPWSVQEMLRYHYEPRQHGKVSTPEPLLRAAHRLYREAA